MMSDNFTNQLIILGLIIFLLGSGCSGQQTVEAKLVTPAPTPTIHPIFAAPSRETTDRPVASPTVEINISESLPPTANPTTTLRSETIFDDVLNDNWTTENSLNFEYDLQADEFSHDGQYSLALTPEAGFGEFIFNVSSEANEEYLREDVLAVRFWLYTGDDYVATDDILVSIVGSNEYSYWVVGDDSVQQIDYSRPLFPSTRLYYLDFNTDIPPERWVQIEVWLNELIFEPEYQYVTGIIIKNDDDFLRKIYVDNVEILFEE